MRKICTKAIVLIALSIGITASVYSQNPQRGYAISGQSIIDQYDLALRSLDRGDYVSAYYSLGFYYSVNLYAGNFSQDPQFEQQVVTNLQKIGDYLSQAVSERDHLRRELQACRGSAQSAIVKRKYGLTVPQVQLPRIPPLQ